MTAGESSGRVNRLMDEVTALRGMLAEMSRLFVRGKLLEDMRSASLRVGLVGVVGGVPAGALTVAGLPAWLAMAVCALAGGFVTTLLLKDIKIG